MRVRTNIYQGVKKVWQDSASDDYIHRPDSEVFRKMCAYEMTMHFRKTPKTYKEMRKIASRPALVEETDDEDELDYNNISEFGRFNGQGYKEKRCIQKVPPRIIFLSLGEA